MFLASKPQKHRLWPGNPVKLGMSRPAGVAQKVYAKIVGIHVLASRTVDVVSLGNLARHYPYGCSQHDLRDNARLETYRAVRNHCFHCLNEGRVLGMSPEPPKIMSGKTDLVQSFCLQKWRFASSCCPLRHRILKRENEQID